MLHSGQKAKFDSEARIEPTTTWLGSLQSSTQQLSTYTHRITAGLKLVVESGVLGPVALICTSKLHINQGFQKREIRVFTP